MTDKLYHAGVGFDAVGDVPPRWSLWRTQAVLRGRIPQVRDRDHGFNPCSTKIANNDGGVRVPATMCAIANAIRWAEEITSQPTFW
jgi:hypothetical protein